MNVFVDTYAVVSADGAFAMQRAANLSLTMRAFNFARPSKSNILLQKVLATEIY